MEVWRSLDPASQRSSFIQVRRCLQSWKVDAWNVIGGGRVDLPEDQAGVILQIWGNDGVALNMALETSRR